MLSRHLWHCLAQSDLQLLDINRHFSARQHLYSFLCFLKQGNPTLCGKKGRKQGRENFFPNTLPAYGGRWVEGIGVVFSPFLFDCFCTFLLSPPTASNQRKMNYVKASTVLPPQSLEKYRIVWIYHFLLAHLWHMCECQSITGYRLFGRHRKDACKILSILNLFFNNGEART